jgi:hypothetical protein
MSVAVSEKIAWQEPLDTTLALVEVAPIKEEVSTTAATIKRLKAPKMTPLLLIRNLP